MNETRDSLAVLEEQLCASLTAQNQTCRRALEIARPLPAAFERGEDPAAALDELGRSMDEVRAAEQAAEESRRRWQAPPRPDSPRVDALLAEARALLEELIEIVGRAESIAERSRSALLPEISQALRGKQMRRAYGASS